MSKNLRDIKEFTRRMPGDTEVRIELEGETDEVKSMKVVKTEEGETLVLVIDVA